ncbi:MAG: peptidase, partial [Hyphomicrobiaceae bacterium]
SLDYQTPLADAMKTGLVSFDSTMRSNLSVGRPLDIAVLASNQSQPPLYRRIEENDPYFSALSSSWAQALAEARARLPLPPFMAELASGD